jgi:ComF family protein
MFYACLHLFFPRICPACGEALLRFEKVICFSCKSSLPQTGYHHQSDNPIAQLFWGRVPVHTAAAFYFFRKSGHVQQLLHQLKYGNRPEIGEEIGSMYGAELAVSASFSSTEIIVPVPLHPQKMRIRGYNQSAEFARGLSRTMNKPALEEALVRNAHSESQTRKARFARWENVNEVFSVRQPELIAGRNILLVDDVITTGATIEACAARLFRAGAGRVSIASIAAPVF